MTDDIPDTPQARAVRVEQYRRDAETAALIDRILREPVPQPGDEVRVIEIGGTRAWESQEQAGRAFGFTGQNVRRAMYGTGRLTKKVRLVHATPPVLRWLVRHPGEPLTWEIYKAVTEAWKERAA